MRSMLLHSHPTTVLARLDRAIHLLTRRAASWIPRSSRAKTVMVLLLAFFTAAPALAASMPKADYRAAMESLDEIETLITQTITALNAGMSQTGARAALPHVQERLQWMRDLKVAAAKVDTSHTLRSRNSDSQRAQCLIMRSGLMDATFQDVMVNVSMKARGVADDALLPMDPDAIAHMTKPRFCS
ncbi:MAG: hypothetical protein Q7S99_12285 [Parvibaculum sp.]|nr:hypothetical protein [Parvibaculum sp.]